MSEHQPGVADLVAALDRLSLAIQARPATAAAAASASPAPSEWELIREEEEEQTHRSQPDLDRRRALVKDGDYNSFAELIPECPRHQRRSFA